MILGLRGTVAYRFPVYTVSQKNDTDIPHYNFNAHQPILVIFGTVTAQGICY